MATREIIIIDEKKCNGCGICIPNCPEGAIQIIDKKARLISDLFCDGLGACIGHCPEDAITIEKREAAPYDERRVMENIIKQGKNVIQAHLNHLEEHKQDKYLNEAKAFLREHAIPIPSKGEKEMSAHQCPGTRSQELTNKNDAEKKGEEPGKRNSHLRQWPIQLHLVSPEAPYYQGADVLLTADCVAYAHADFHKEHLQGKAIAIACPKLDTDQDIYKEKIIAMIDSSKINTLTVMIMEVPCCGGLLHVAKQAQESAQRKVPIKTITVSLQGKIVSEEWV